MKHLPSSSVPRTVLRSPVTGLQIRTIAPLELRRFLPVLVALRRDLVNEQAALGFARNVLPENEHYWLSLCGPLQSGSRILFGAFTGRQLIGAALVGLPDWTNSRHRAEVLQLVGARGARGQGVGHALLAAVHAESRLRDRSLVVFNTRAGNPCADLYLEAGYREASSSVGLLGMRSEVLTLYYDLVSPAETERPRRAARRRA